MESIKELYKIGRGPSSSHTIGPERACKIFMQKNPSASRLEAVLYGSLAKTGKGHGTDEVIKKTFYPKECKIGFNCTESNIPHPNTMRLSAYNGDKLTDSTLVFSVGGGSIVFENSDAKEKAEYYEVNKFSDISKYCAQNRTRLWEYVYQMEDANFEMFLETIWSTMRQSIERGLNDDGILPGSLNVQKKGKVPV